MLMPQMLTWITTEKKIGEGAFQWKINFNPDPTKQAQELIFNHPLLFFNQNAAPQISLQKHLRIFVDSRLNFSEHVRIIF